MIRLNALIVDGMMRARKLSIMPSSFTTRNVGMSPPLNSIVNTTRNITARRPSKSRRDSPYAISKLAQEALALIPEDGLDVIVARAFNHTGPRQQPAFVASSVARQVALIERGALAPVLRVGNLDARRDLTDVRDVVRAYMSLVESAPPGQVYNVASGVGRPIRSIVETLVRLAAVQVRIEVDPGRLRAQDKPVLVGDAGRLRAATGWEPRISFEQTLRDLLDYWRATA